jgi:hypothetical protein
MSIDIEGFRIRLAETIAWCTQGNFNPDFVVHRPALSLRSLILRPPGLRISSRLGVELQRIVNAVAEERAYLVQAWSHKAVKPARDLAGGRLLLCTSATESIPDGYVSSASEGFYDDDDLPPWDTWLYYLESGKEAPTTLRPGYQPEYLLSWVPAVCVGLAKVGVEEHFLDCMRWATQVDIPLTRRLSEAGLLG